MELAGPGVGNALRVDADGEHAAEVAGDDGVRELEGDALLKLRVQRVMDTGPLEVGLAVLARRVGLVALAGQTEGVAVEVGAQGITTDAVGGGRPREAAARPALGGPRGARGGAGGTGRLGRPVGAERGCGRLVRGHR